MESLKEEMHHARQLFLFGAGKIKPVKNPKRLAEMSGVSERSLRRHLPSWRQEAENLALQATECPYSLALSTETLEHHRKHVDFLKKQVDKCARVLKSLTPGTQSYIVNLNAYQSALTKWEKSSGIQAHHDAVAGAMRENAKTAARVKAKKSDDSPRRKITVDKTRFDVEG